MTAPQVVSSIQAVTTQSRALQAPTQSITILSGPLFLNMMIGKAGILNDIALVAPPISSVLRAFEGGIDTWAYNLIGLVPDVASTFTAKKDQLGGVMGQAIRSYTPTK